MKRQLIIIFILTFLITDTIKSCDCKPLPSVLDAVKKSDLVISGIIIKVEYEHTLSQSQGYLDTLGREREKAMFEPLQVNQYTILVKKTYKGQTKSDTIILRTNLDPASDCGLLLDLNKNYIFYLYDVNKGNVFFDNIYKKTFTSSVCTRTREFDKDEDAKLNSMGSR